LKSNRFFARLFLAIAPEKVISASIRPQNGPKMASENTFSGRNGSKNRLFTPLLSAKNGITALESSHLALPPVPLKTPAAMC
jgi:hypothetical protein